MRKHKASYIGPPPRCTVAEKPYACTTSEKLVLSPRNPGHLTCFRHPLPPFSAQQKGGTSRKSRRMRRRLECTVQAFNCGGYLGLGGPFGAVERDVQGPECAAPAAPKTTARHHLRRHYRKYEQVFCRHESCRHWCSNMIGPVSLSTYPSHVATSYKEEPR